MQIPILLDFFSWSWRGFCRNWQLIGTWTKRSLRSAWWPLKRRRFHFINVCRLKARGGGRERERGKGRKDGAEGGCYSENVLLISVICLRCEKEAEWKRQRETERLGMTSLKLDSDAAAFSDFHIKAWCYQMWEMQKRQQQGGVGRGGAAGNVSLCWCGKMLPMIAQKTNKTEATQLRSNE